MAGYLNEDIVKVSGQNYALISVVSKESSNQKTDGPCAVKIRGCFDTKDEAEAHLKRLMKFDKEFDVFLVSMYNWLLIPPPLDKLDDVVYQEEFLNDMMKGHKESQLLAKEHFQERKQMIMERGLDAALSPEEKITPPIEPLAPPERWMPLADGEEEDKPSGST